MKFNGLTAIFIGLAWVFVGLGFSIMHFQFLPSGTELIGKMIGLLIAGAITGALGLSLQSGMPTSSSRGFFWFGYLLFAPLGILGALVAPSTISAEAGSSGIAFVLGAPLIMSLYASLIMSIGLLLFAGMALMMNRIAAWRESDFMATPLAMPLKIRH